MVHFIVDEKNNFYLIFGKMERSCSPCKLDLHQPLRSMSITTNVV